MLIKSSGHLEGGLYLFTLGDSCHYALSSLLPPSASPPEAANAQDSAHEGAHGAAPHDSITPEPITPRPVTPRNPKHPGLSNSPFAVFDPGSSAHAEHLITRLESQGFNLKNLQFIFPTHLHPERISGIPLLRSRAPQAIFVASQQMKRMLSDKGFVAALHTEDQRMREELSAGVLKLSPAEITEGFKVDECLSDSDVIAIGDDTTMRANIQAGHSPCSLSYFIQPHEYLICDETLGYYRGRELPAPAPDDDRAQYRKSLAQIAKLELRALCLPYAGVLTGELLPKHLQRLNSTLDDIEKQFAQAAAGGVSHEEFRAALRSQVFNSLSRDPILTYAMERSFEALSTQLLKSCS